MNPEVDFSVLQANRECLGPEEIACLEARYDSEIAFTDYHIGHLLEELRRLGLDESTLVVFTADHGEEFLEHGWLGHTQHLYEEIIRVPLIIRNPRIQDWPDSFSPPVELIDLMPTLLEMVGIAPGDQQIDGRCLLDAVSGRSRTHRVAFSEVRFPGDPGKTLTGVDCHLTSLRTERWKIVYDRAREKQEVYDLVCDPAELHDIAGRAENPQVARMEEQLLHWIKSQKDLALAEDTAPDTIMVVDEETEERLRALGYVH